MFEVVVESMFLTWGGSESQKWGAQQLNALLPMVGRQVEGTDRCMEEEDLRGRECVGTWRRSDSYGERGCGKLKMLTGSSGLVGV